MQWRVTRRASRGFATAERLFRLTAAYMMIRQMVVRAWSAGVSGGNAGGFRMTTILVATGTGVLCCGVEGGTMTAARGLDGERPTCLVADPRVPGRAWCGTHRGGVFRSDDAGGSWRPVGLDDLRITAVAASPAEAMVWVGTEPSDVWQSDDDGATWRRTRRLDELSSSSEWSFPPRPDTHHVRWIACHPEQPGRLWVAVEAGALVATRDGGRTWQDRDADGHRLAGAPVLGNLRPVRLLTIVLIDVAYPLAVRRLRRSNCPR